MSSESHSLTNSSALNAGLECVIGRGRFALPMESVAQVIECELGPPPPLASLWVGGVGFQEGRALVSVALTRPTGPEVPRRMIKGIRLAVAGAPTDWALEVTSVAGFVKARVHNQGVLIGQTRLPLWVTAATLADGRSLGWIHVSSMLRDLAG